MKPCVFSLALLSWQVGFIAPDFRVQMQLCDQRYLGLFGAVVHCNEILHNAGTFEPRVTKDSILSEMVVGGSRGYTTAPKMTVDIYT